ncbi:hypothetical protein QN277_015583 [Acacia crassicarpa]|uniref:Glucosamine/galactosamine-6-phosphate isomerase domain-containing protein n=1 Tax=Acacia crassicarpa TaxID=499986 RepID=A0AAE1JW57_9FABA|nr:hypothetical protein QN277_015583 [Acacia crassicarpa]
MALSSAFLASSSLCVPQTSSRPLLGVQRPHSALSQTMSSSMMILPHGQARGKSQNQPLKSTYRRSSFGTVRAIATPETGAQRYRKNVEVLSREHLVDSLAHDIIRLSQKCIDERGSFSFAIADTTSVQFLSKLVSPEMTTSIDWAKWQVFWVEEEVVVGGYDLKRRFLPNELLHPFVYEEFLNKVKKAGPYVVSIDYELIAKQDAADRYEAILRNMVVEGKLASSSIGLPKFDLMLLGMEEDARVGSLIPDHPVLNEQERWATHVHHRDEKPHLTLTPPVINSSSNIAMVVSGLECANAVYNSLMDGADNRLLPAKIISPEKGNVFWYLDQDAASRIFKQELYIDQRRSY